MWYTPTPDIFEGAERQVFERLSRAVYLRRVGGDCYNYGLLASGHIDLVIEAGLQPYDYLAVAPVIEQAGGVITAWSGHALTMHSGGRVLASANDALHEKALALVNAGKEIRHSRPPVPHPPIRPPSNTQKPKSRQAKNTNP